MSTLKKGKLYAVSEPTLDRRIAKRRADRLRDNAARGEGPLPVNITPLRESEMQKAVVLISHIRGSVFIDVNIAGVYRAFPGAMERVDSQKHEDEIIKRIYAIAVNCWNRVAQLGDGRGNKIRLGATSSFGNDYVIEHVYRTIFSQLENEIGSIVIEARQWVGFGSGYQERIAQFKAEF